MPTDPDPDLSGASAPLKQLLTRFGVTPDRVADVARQCAAAAAEEMPR
jgi:hypothetical protein